MAKITIVQAPTRDEMWGALLNPDYTIHFVLRDSDGTEYEAICGVEMASEDSVKFTCTGDLLSTKWPSGEGEASYSAEWKLDGKSGTFRLGSYTFA